MARASVDSQVTSAELVANHVISLKGICREKITNLKSWAVYFLLCRENASSEQGKYTASERVQISDSRCGRARLVAFLGVRNHQQIASRIFFTSGFIQWCPGGVGAAFGLVGAVRRVESPPPILWILSGSSLFPSLRRWMSLVWAMRKLRNLACLCSELDSLSHPRRKTPRPGPGRGT